MRRRAPSSRDTGSRADAGAAFCELTYIASVAPDMTITALAAEATERYGMDGGRLGILNLGDCFSCATARRLKAKLSFKGDDFGRTDIEPA